MAEVTAKPGDAKPGDEVVAETFESIEYDRPPETIRGALEIRHIPALDYDQYLVGGIPVDSETVRPA